VAATIVMAVAVEAAAEVVKAVALAASVEVEVEGAGRGLVMTWSLRGRLWGCCRGAALRTCPLAACKIAVAVFTEHN
jgi:hypothetical protein